MEGWSWHNILHKGNKIYTNTAANNGTKVQLLISLHKNLQYLQIQSTDTMCVFLNDPIY